MFQFWMEFEYLLNHGDSFRKNASSVSTKLIQLSDLTYWHGFCLYFIPKALILFSFDLSVLCVSFISDIYLSCEHLGEGIAAPLEKVTFICHWTDLTNLIDMGIWKILVAWCLCIIINNFGNLMKILINKILQLFLIFCESLLNYYCQ